MDPQWDQVVYQIALTILGLHTSETKQYHNKSYEWIITDISVNFENSKIKQSQFRSVQYINTLQTLQNIFSKTTVKFHSDFQS